MATNLIALAKQADGIITPMGAWLFSPESLQAFAEAIRLDERESQTYLITALRERWTEAELVEIIRARTTT